MVITPLGRLYIALMNLSLAAKSHESISPTPKFSTSSFTSGSFFEISQITVSLKSERYSETAMKFSGANAMTALAAFAMALSFSPPFKAARLTGESF